MKLHPADREAIIGMREQINSNPPMNPGAMPCPIAPEVRCARALESIAYSLSILVLSLDETREHVDDSELQAQLGRTQQRS